MTTLNVRIDDGLKAKASKTLSGLGLDMSTAVKMFLHQVIIEKGLPFTSTKDLNVIKTRWDKQVAYALKYGKSYKTAKEALAGLL